MNGKPIGLAFFPVLAVNPTPAWELLPRLLDVLRSGRYPAVAWQLADGGTVYRQKLCGPLRPSVAFRFQTPRGAVELLVCFGCTQAVLSDGDVEVLLHIDYVWRQLLDLALESFPFDALLTDLAERR